MARKDRGERGPGSFVPIVVALISAVAVIAAAFITGAYQGHAVGLPVPRTTVTVTVAASPATGRAGHRGSAISAPTPAPAILAPVSQAGWSLAYHGSVLIGAQGIVMQQSGPQQADGSDYDIQYITANNSYWGSNNNTYRWTYWLNSNHPGPAAINGIVQNGSSIGQAPDGQPAAVGQRIWWENGDNNIVAYMQVTKVGPSGVTVDMWTWNQSA